jgi:hypothetical protein
MEGAAAAVADGQHCSNPGLKTAIWPAFPLVSALLVGATGFEPVTLPCQEKTRRDGAAGIEHFGE